MANKTDEEKGKYDAIQVRPLAKEERERLENNFRYHEPFGPQSQKYQLIRSESKDLAEFYCHACPPSRELSLALTHLEEAMFWANAAIARNEKDDQNA